MTVPGYGPAMYRFTPEEAARIIADEDALATLRGYPIEEVWAHVESPDDVGDDGEAFAVLMGVMYELRPVGHT